MRLQSKKQSPLVSKKSTRHSRQLARGRRLRRLESVSKHSKSSKMRISSTKKSQATSTGQESFTTTWPKWSGDSGTSAKGLCGLEGKKPPSLKSTFLLDTTTPCRSDQSLSDISTPLAALSISSPPLQPRQYTGSAPTSPPLTAPIATRAPVSPPGNATWAPQMGIKFGAPPEGSGITQTAPTERRPWDPRAGVKFG